MNNKMKYLILKNILKIFKLINKMNYLILKNIHNFSNFIEKWIQPFFDLLIFFRVQLTIALVTLIVFTQIDQTIEVYQSIALDGDSKKAIVYACSSTFCMSILSFFMWYTSLMLKMKIYDKKKRKNRNIIVENWITESVIILIGIIPGFSLLLGIMRALYRHQNETSSIFLMLWEFFSIVFFVIVILCLISYKKNRNKLIESGIEIIFFHMAHFILNVFSLPLIVATSSTKSAGAIAIFSVSLLLIVINFPYKLRIAQIYFTSKKKKKNSYTRKISYANLFFLFFPLAIIFFIFCILIIIKFPPNLFRLDRIIYTTFSPSLFGVISVLCIAFTALLIIFSTIYSWGHRTNIPSLTILIGLVILFSLFNWNDNHRFRTIEHKPDSPVLPLEESFQTWLDSRPDRDKYKGKPYPVYIASAQGGGIFAAYHAATAFAQLTEYAPSFPQHIFAISSVSGGSLGASVYASLIKESADNSQEYNTPKLIDKVSTFFNQDFLSPLFAFGMFPDLIQGFIPFPIYDWDRANGLEFAIENAWSYEDRKNQNPFKGSFYDHWKAKGVAPALVINTTVVESGKRLVISPFNEIGENLDVLDNVDLRLSTAAGLSARFPFITPVGWYKKRDNSISHLVDGGYFDNSGIITALDIGQSLEKREDYKKSFEIIYLTIVNQPEDDSEKQLKFPVLSEIRSPMQAMFNAREAKGLSLIDLLKFTKNHDKGLSLIDLSKFTKNHDIEDPLKYRFQTLMLQKEDKNRNIKLPLGWKISETSKDFIREQTPDPNIHICDVKKFSSSSSGREVYKKNVDVKNNNICIAQSIKEKLS